MNRKKLSTLFFIIAFVALATGAAFHGFRMHPENVANYRIGVAMGIAMAAVFVISVVCGIVMRVRGKK